MTTRIITICSLRHRDVWKLTSQLLPKFVEADEFFVYVPENEVIEFRSITPSHFQVVSQSTLGFGYIEELQRQVGIAGNSQRFGWYLQQFFKIEALITANADHLVIWDADCVPVKNIPLFSRDGRPLYMRASKENVSFYFEAIERLLELSRIQDFSFVIPGFPILRDWVSAFIAEIESLHPGKKWFEAIIETTDLSLTSGFSETETLGTWIANTQPGNWATIPGNWERLGQRRFGYARKFDTERLIEIGKKNNLDIISFENWDSRGIKLQVKRVKRILRMIIFLKKE